MTLSPLTRIRIARRFFAVAQDPRRLDEVLGMADEIGGSRDAAEELPEHLVAVALAMPEQAELPPLEELRAYAPGTVGRTYADFMDANGLMPEALSYPEGSTEADRFRRHMRTSHDLWHVATGWHPDGVGELGLQGFYLAQLRFAFPALILGAGLVHVLWKRQDLAWDVGDAVAEGWRQGSDAELLVGVDWASWMGRPLDELRAELGIEAAGEREQRMPLVA
jgi:ubiquinone biosynthesis protein COQ4